MAQEEMSEKSVCVDGKQTEIKLDDCYLREFIAC